MFHHLQSLVVAGLSAIDKVIKGGGEEAVWLKMLQAMITVSSDRNRLKSKDVTSQVGISL